MIPYPAKSFKFFYDYPAFMPPQRVIYSFILLFTRLSLPLLFLTPFFSPHSLFPSEKTGPAGLIFCGKTAKIEPLRPRLSHQRSAGRRPQRPTSKGDL
jgi:hypothetical protein